MKLVFPDGEHGPLLLSAGLYRIGTAAGGAVVLGADGVGALHCEIHVTGTGANVQVPLGGGPVAVNGRSVSDIMALRDGDRIEIGPVVAKFVRLESAPGRMASDGAHDVDDDLGATRVRTALPRFVLRGVSGAVLGKVFPVTGAVVIGRAPECDITLTVGEISRRHALLKPVGDGLSVEDLESSNGTYINTRRVQQGFLSPGDELGLDVVRFVLVAPGMKTSQQTGQTKAVDPAARPEPAAIRRWMPIMLTALVGLVVAGVVLGFG